MWKTIIVVRPPRSRTLIRKRGSTSVSWKNVDGVSQIEEADGGSEVLLKQIGGGLGSRTGRWLARFGSDGLGVELVNHELDVGKLVVEVLELLSGTDVVWILLAGKILLPNFQFQFLKNKLDKYKRSATWFRISGSVAEWTGASENPGSIIWSSKKALPTSPKESSRLLQTQ